MIRVKKTMFHAASAFYKEIIDRISQEIILYNITNGGIYDEKITGTSDGTSFDQALRHVLKTTQFPIRHHSSSSDSNTKNLSTWLKSRVTGFLSSCLLTSSMLKPMNFGSMFFTNDENTVNYTRSTDKDSTTSVILLMMFC